MAKKYFILLMAFLFGTFLSACGAEKEPENVWRGIGPGADLTAVTERTEYYDLTVETEELLDLGLWEQNPELYSVSLIHEGEIIYQPLGTQFLAGEPVQIWSEMTRDGADIYLYREDGSRELLLQGISVNYASVDSKFKCYLDREGNCFFYRTDFLMIDGRDQYVGLIVKMLPTGDILYENSLEPGFMINDICQMEDGRIYLLLYNDTMNEQVLEELDAETGRLLSESGLRLSFGAVRLGTENGSPAVAGYGIGGGSGGIAAVDMEAQSTSGLLYFHGTSYGWHGDFGGLPLQDFRVLTDGSIEFLWTDRAGLNCFREVLRMEKVEKIPIVLRAIITDDWFSEQVALFNRENDKYHVILENCGYGNDLEDFRRLTSVQVGAGKGPDILCGQDLLQGYLEGMLEKGALEVLNPYLEASGIREEDYFPLAFSAWRQGDQIYGVTPKIEAYYEEVDAELLGSSETPDIEGLADALLAWEEGGVYRRWMDSAGLLNTFLQGTENLWGMVDWENGSCDFDTPLFRKLLEAADRYGDDGRKEMEPEIVNKINLISFFSFNGSVERKARGSVPSGVLFDDGCYGVSVPQYTMAVNAASAHKEGAWEFISFLLGDQVQGVQKMYLPPVKKESFDQWLEWFVPYMSEERTEAGHTMRPAYYGENTSEERRKEYKKALEEIRPLPMGTSLILTIIGEEAAYYFDDSKSADEVISMINNRVQLYLNER